MSSPPVARHASNLAAPVPGGSPLHPSHPDYHKLQKLTGVAGDLGGLVIAAAPEGVDPALLQHGSETRSARVSDDQEKWAIGAFWEQGDLTAKTIGGVLQTVHAEEKDSPLTVDALKAKLDVNFQQLLKKPGFVREFLEFCVDKGVENFDDSKKKLAIALNDQSQIDVSNFETNAGLRILFDVLVDKALSKKCSPSAAGQIIFKVADETGQESLYLLVSKSARRHLQNQAWNGNLETSELPKQALLREPVEELNLYNLEDNSIAKLVQQDPQGVRLGGDVTDLTVVARKMSLRKSLYLNFAAVFSNHEAVKLQELNDNVAQLNQRLENTNPFYQPAVNWLYPKKDSEFVEKAELFKLALDCEKDLKQAIEILKKNLGSLQAPEQTTDTIDIDALVDQKIVDANKAKNSAKKLVQEFLDNPVCKSVILPHQQDKAFGPFLTSVQSNQEPSAACIINCLLEIIDLTENERVELWSEAAFKGIYQSWASANKEKMEGKPNLMREFEKQYFDAGYSLFEAALERLGDNSEEGLANPLRTLRDSYLPLL